MVFYSRIRTRIKNPAVVAPNNETGAKIVASALVYPNIIAKTGFTRKGAPNPPPFPNPPPKNNITHPIISRAVTSSKSV